MDIVSWTFANNEYDQNRPIFIDASRPGKSVSASQARRFVRHLVAGLKAIGLQNGDYVCILSYSQVFYPILYLGIIGAGGCVVGCNPSHTQPELASQLTTCGAKYIITELQIYEKASAIASECNIPISNIYICDRGDQSLRREYCSWTDLLQHGMCDWNQLNKEEAERTVAVLYSTSGTTGLPKSAMMSHTHCIDVAKFVEQSSLGKPYQLSRLVALPLLHAFAAPLVHMSALREGIPTYLMHRFDLAGFVDAIERFQITEIPMVPSMMVAAISSTAFKPDRLSSIRHIWTAGAPLSLTVKTRFQSLLHVEARIVPVYGMTECGWITSLTYPEKESSDSVGKPVPGMSLKLVDDAGNQVSKDGQLGELLVRPQHPTLGYIGNSKATEELYHEPGWIKSGDVAYVSEGRYYIVDRKKDLIKVRSWQVSPSELENVLLQHKDIDDVAVIGVPDYGISGEIPHAFVVKSPASRCLELAEIQSFMCERLARYKQIERLTMLSRIPRNPAGKILKRNLRESLLQAQPSKRNIDNIAVAHGSVHLDESETLFDVIITTGHEYMELKA